MIFQNLSLILLNWGEYETYFHRNTQDIKLAYLIPANFIYSMHEFAMYVLGADPEFYFREVGEGGGRKESCAYHELESPLRPGSWKL